MSFDVSISMPPGQEKFVAIAELKGWGYSNSDVRGYISALSILQVQLTYFFHFLVCVSFSSSNINMANKRHYFHLVR